MTYIPDPTELIDARIDELCDIQFGGVPTGMIRCYDCRKIVSINHVEPADAHPASPAVCFDCLDKRGVSQHE